MKHRMKVNALSRKSSHRKALIRNMVTSLFKYERIETTKAKALEVRKVAEKMITRAKNDCVHARRIVDKNVKDEAVLNKLFVEIAPLFKERAGGYTRILKIGFRAGDAAQMVILELVEKTENAKEKSSKDKKKDSKEKVAKKSSDKKAHIKSENVKANKAAVTKTIKTSTKNK